MNNKFNSKILDCLLHGKFSKAGDLGTHLILEDSLSETTRVSLMESLRCEMPRCSKGSKLFFKDIMPIHIKSALKATRAIIDCMADTDVKLFLRFSMKSLLTIFLSLIEVPYLELIKTLKYYTSYPLAFFLKNDLPPKPENITGKYPFPGNSAIRSWFKTRLFSKSHYTRNLKFFWSLLQGVKRACEFADYTFIQMTMVKHSQVLSKVDTTNTLMYNRDLKTGEYNSSVNVKIDTVEFVNEQLEAFRKESLNLFRGFDPLLDKEYEISNSACWERTRSSGGSRAEILDIANDVYCSVHRILCSSLSSVLHQMVEVRPGSVKELRGVRGPVWQDLLSQVSLKPCAMVAAILEPLKVRLITKGPAVDYFLSKSLQKSLFRHLRTFPQFELIGDPLREDHLYRMIEREKKLVDKGMTFSHFVSGDYSAATDNLKIAYTKVGLESSLVGVNTPLLKAFRNTLYEHEIYYPSFYGLDSISQRSGQLMGSPLSFPFLCTNNLIAYKLSLEDYLHKKINIRDLPCLINGDDILFRTNPEHYELWKKRVSSIGFDLSIGKNYIHEKVLTINSTCFKFENSAFKKVDFCNFGLLSGTSKLGGSRGEVREKAVDLCDAYTRSVGGSSNKSLAHAKFITRNRVDLQKITHRGRYNLFLPRVLGGLGFTPYEGITFHVTRFQMCLAKLIRKTLDFNLVGFRTDGVVNSLLIRESNNSKRIQLGYGPLCEFDREIEDKTVLETNGSYLQDTTMKFFTKIGEKYDSKTLFPFRLKSEKIDLNSDLFRIIGDYNPF